MENKKNLETLQIKYKLKKTKLLRVRRTNAKIKS